MTACLSLPREALRPGNASRRLTRLFSRDHVCACRVRQDHEVHACVCGWVWFPAEADAYRHEHDDSHDDCPDCASMDAMRLCVDCLDYAASDQ